MKIVVCIRQGRDGEINPFDACALEEALRVDGAEVVMLSMGVPSTESFLLNLTRLGAKEGILLTDGIFAGADTLATAYALSLAIKKINPDLVFCGRRTLEGDTAQTAPMISEKIGFNLITNAMSVNVSEKTVSCDTREEGKIEKPFPCLVTVERINTLRMPSIRSKIGNVTVWNGKDIGADPNRCGLLGSPTRVVSSTENTSGRRKCKFIDVSELESAIKIGLEKQKEKTQSKTEISGKRLNKVYIVGESPRSFAESVSDDIKIIPLTTPEEISDIIVNEKPNVVLWGSDSASKRVASCVAAMLDIGLCADCTALKTDGEDLFMIRPALSGSVIATVKSITKPAMATVRTTDKDTKDIMLCVGFGARQEKENLALFAEKIGAELTTTRKCVDNDIMPYPLQVGLTGKTVAPAVYIAVGVSGAVHHLVGMEYSGTVIAVNPDKEAKIFDFADFGIVAETKDIFR